MPAAISFLLAMLSSSLCPLVPFLYSAIFHPVFVSPLITSYLLRRLLPLLYFAVSYYFCISRSLAFSLLCRLFCPFITSPSQIAWAAACFLITPHLCRIYLTQPLIFHLYFPTYYFWEFLYPSISNSLFAFPSSNCAVPI